VPDELTVLTAEEGAALEAVLDRLIPADDNGPGAREARVLRFVDRALGGPLRQLREGYRANLAALDALAAARHGSRFAGLAPVDQDALLAELERGGPAGFSPSAQAFLDLVRVHAIHGMFGDPAHGGNAGRIGWRLLGYRGPRAVVPAGDQGLD
jgi:gluconate 2-dehydrogenase gamma chain